MPGRGARRNQNLISRATGSSSSDLRRSMTLRIPAASILARSSQPPWPTMTIEPCYLITAPDGSSDGCSGAEAVDPATAPTAWQPPAVDGSWNGGSDGPSPVSNTTGSWRTSARTVVPCKEVIPTRSPAFHSQGAARTPRPTDPPARHRPAAELILHRCPR